MQAEFEDPRSDAIVIVGIIWIAALLAVLAGLLAYIAVQSYDPSLSCDELGAKLHSAGGLPENLDAWDDYELICNGNYWRP